METNTIVQHPVEEVSESIPRIEQSASEISRIQLDKSSKPQAEKKVDKQQIDESTAFEIADKMNTVAQVFNTSLTFSVDKSTGKTVITVIDKDTDKIVRQIPPEETLRLIGKMRNVMGMLFDIEI